MTGQALILSQITEMNKSPLQQHILTLLQSEGRSIDHTALYMRQAAALIPQLLEIDGSRPSHQRLLRLLEELPALPPDTQASMMMGLHQTSTENDIEEMASEMTAITELDELALLIADNLLGVLSR